MKLSVSLSEKDVALLDEYARIAGLPSRSAALQRAIQMLRHLNLEREYADAWDEWGSSGEGALWDAAAGDGIVPDGGFADAPR